MRFVRRVVGACRKLNRVGGKMIGWNRVCMVWFQASARGRMEVVPGLLLWAGRSQVRLDHCCAASCLADVHGLLQLDFLLEVSLQHDGVWLELVVGLVDGGGGCGARHKLEAVLVQTWRGCD